MVYEVNFEITTVTFPDCYGNCTERDNFTLIFENLDYNKWAVAALKQRPYCDSVWMSYLPPLTQGDPISFHWEKREGKWFSVEHTNCLDIEPRVEPATYLDEIRGER